MEDRSKRIQSIFDQLGIKESNPGACSCVNSWSSDPEGKDLGKIEPGFGDAISLLITSMHSGTILPRSFTTYSW